MREEIGRETVCACEVVTHPEFRLLGKRVSYLSPVGAFLESTEQVDVGHEVVLSLQLPGDRWIDAEARVSRVVQLGVFTQGIGLRFERLDEESRSELAALFDAVDNSPLDALDVALQSLDIDDGEIAPDATVSAQ